MNETCTLIKNSELSALREEVAKCKKYTKETIEKKTAQLKNDISEKDKEIDALKKTIEQMEKHPQVDPMKLTLFLQKASWNLKYAGCGAYREDLVVNDNVVEPINFNLDQPLAKQIRNMLTIFNNRDKKITERQIIDSAGSQLRKVKDIYADEIIVEFAKKGFFKKLGIVEDAKERINKRVLQKIAEQYQ